MSDRGRGHLQLLPAPEDREDREGSPSDGSPGASGRTGNTTSARRLAPNAPRSPGTVPFELAQELEVGEPLVWWGRKDSFEWVPVIWMLVAGLSLLVLATLFAPEMWQQPLDELWKPLVPALAPAALLAAREWFNQRAVMVTDKALVAFDHRGRVQRIQFRNIRLIDRDLLTGGVRIEGARRKLRLPPSLAEDARLAVESQLSGTIRAQEGPDDRIGWLGRA